VVNFSVSEPDNLDAEQYRNQLIWDLVPAVNHYPTTDYTAELLCNLAREGVSAGDIPNLVQQRDPRSSFGKDPIYEIRDGWNAKPPVTDRASLMGTFSEYAEWRGAAFETALKYHPDLWCADGLRLQHAFDLLTLRRDDEALKIIRDVAENKSSRYSPVASSLLEHLKNADFATTPKE
jgi:hypothetical protein